MSGDRPTMSEIDIKYVNEVTTMLTETNNNVNITC